MVGQDVECTVLKCNHFSFPSKISITHTSEKNSFQLKKGVVFIIEWYCFPHFSKYFLNHHLAKKYFPFFNLKSWNYVITLSTFCAICLYQVKLRNS